MGVTMRDAFGRKLAAMGGEHRDLVVLDADVSTSTRSLYFAQAYPERFFNVGVVVWMRFVINLRPPREARFNEVANVVIRHLALIHSDKRRELGSRSDKRHLSAKHI